MSILNGFMSAAVSAPPPPVEYVGSASGGISNGLGVQVDISAIGIQAGDLIIAVHAVGEDSNETSYMSAASAGYTEISSQYGNDSFDVNLKVYAKISNGTDTTFVTNNVRLSTSSVIVAVAVFRGPSVIPVDAATGLYAEAVTANTDDITWPSVPTSAGQALLYIGAVGHISVVQLFTDPQDLSDFLTLGQNDSEDVTLGVGHKLITTETSFSANDWLLAANGANSSTASVILRLET